ncbi:MAG: CDP-glycerol glycerophosphotransferase family protein [Lachnospiraceae bacterium]|nr:CDP-glycerol glycerophosphotransferase family protein [Lachnospiraceae bacterium]
MHRIVNLLKRYYHYRQYQKLLKYRKYARYGADFRSIARIKEYVKDRLLLILLRVFYIFPVKKNRVLFMSFEAGKYACNPRRISEYLAKNYPGELEIVWAFQNPDDFRWLADWGVSKTVEYNTRKFYYYALTSKVFIYNMRIPAMIPFRKSQTTIGTGHGGGAYKKLLLDNPSIRTADMKIQELSASHTDILVSSCKYYTKYVVRGAFAHKGECLECGMPRNDELVNNHDTKTADYIRKYYNIPADNKIILYAPTYRKGKRNEATDYNLDVRGIVEAAKERFGGEWTILYRMHYFIKKRLPADTKGQHIIDVTDYGDMQDLLLASDILITDYSSSVWDYSLLKRPCFLYTTDLDEYLETQGFYVDVRDWPFPLSKTNEGLVKNILEFDEDSYLKDVHKHHTDLGSFDNGNATEVISNRILQECQIDQ